MAFRTGHEVCRKDEGTGACKWSVMGKCLLSRDAVLSLRISLRATDSPAAFVAWYFKPARDHRTRTRPRKPKVECAEWPSSSSLKPRRFRSLETSDFQSSLQLMSSSSEDSEQRRHKSFVSAQMPSSAPLSVRLSPES